MAAMTTAHADAAAYLETERRHDRFVVASSDVRPPRSNVRYDVMIASR